ncbi:PmeII family type II restriction endonuclease [Corynebacterium variabile]|uniref:PmeII family type II restriction endonuclease n=1 Tax=Corynebacterium variabile TaxID=1727 RepID=UPI0028A1F2DA|nr:PmeII family type II restriction endonuclease [Corynebacterium variabile]
MSTESADAPDVYVNHLRRRELQPEMTKRQFDLVTEKALDFIEGRFDTMQKLDAVVKTNINPFLMLAMAPAYNIFSPFEAAEYLQYAKMPHGDSTSFGRLVEEKIFPIFGVEIVEEKKTQKTKYSAIDGKLTVEGEDFLATWKSGPWTMNQSHANEMSANFPSIYQETGKRIILGIFYGVPSQMNNKPSLVRKNTDDYFEVLIGSELWEFVTGVRNAHMEVLRAFRQAQQEFSLKHGGKTFHEHMIESRLKLSQDFRTQFGLIGEDDDMWEALFRHAF